MEENIKTGADLNSGGTALSVVDVLRTERESISGLSCVLSKARNTSHTTTPRTGLSARLAIPVLNAREVISKIAVPVVSEPVPAVVGTAMSGLRVCLMGRPLPMGALIKSMRSASLYTVNLLAINQKGDLGGE